jgi:hypothetical protein
MCLLARYAQARGGDALVVTEMKEVLDRLQCAGERVILTSVELLCREMDLARATCPVRRFAPRLTPDLLEVLQAVDGGDGQRFKDACPGIVLDDGDCTLLATADAWDGLMTMVTDDLDLFDACCEFAGHLETDALPLLAVDLAVQMYECGAFEFQDIEEIVGLEAEHYDTFPMKPERQKRKQLKLRQAMDRAATIRVERETGRRQ